MKRNKNNHNRLKLILVHLILVLTTAPFAVNGQSTQISNLDEVNGFKIFKFNDPISKHINYIKADTSIKQNKNIKSYVYKKQDLTISNLPILQISLDFLYGKLYHIKIMIGKQIKVDEYEKMHALGLPTDFDRLDQDLVKAFGQATSHYKEVEFGNVVDWNIVWETQNIKLNKCEVHNIIFDKNKGEEIICVVDFYYKPALQKISLLDFK